MNQNSSGQSKTILLAVLFLVFGFFAGQGIANQSYLDLGASARSSTLSNTINNTGGAGNKPNACALAMDACGDWCTNNLPNNSTQQNDCYQYCIDAYRGCPNTLIGIQNQ